MLVPMKTWSRFPSHWVDAARLKELSWASDGSANTAALMVLTPIVHVAGDPDGMCQLTYDKLQHATGLSRAKISEGLRILEKLGVVTRSPDRRSVYRLTGYGPMSEGGWAKFPVRRMYARDGQIIPFRDFKLRSRVELNSLKLFYLLVARRGSDTNTANISYERMVEYTGIDRNHIKSGLSLLIENVMIQTEQKISSSNEHAVFNTYRICGIDPYTHQGTTGRVSL
jgi:DNA-binding transcriptional ArsR family regulator